ncbi:putative ubiquitin-conjugating enzyme E2, ubiquitin-conjugating enzyme/RWD [Helianthus annuus]|nr:putative ubiquitin-conjugating enzyme E2, ubiquitin-conjugating enzyme/RWD [Helianthus annuus]
MTIDFWGELLWESWKIHLRGKPSSPATCLTLNDYMVASSKRKEVVFDDTVFDEITDDDDGLDAAVNNMCKAVLHHTFSAREAQFLSAADPYTLKKNRLDPQGNWASCSRFLAFSEQYRSKFNEFMERFSRAGIYTLGDSFPESWRIHELAMLKDEDVLQMYKNFKRFDTTVDLSDHLFSTSPVEQTTERWAERIRDEWRILKERLPETIFVRVYESRMDLLRAVIIGPKGTPYHDGLFFFDVYFPPMYPSVPPLVRYHTMFGAFGGINPHMFGCGEVRLSLFRPSAHTGESIWVPFHTTMLQLLVTIQDRVLNAAPLFHQPGFLDSGPSVVAEYFSLLYNERILIRSLKIMTYIMNKPPKNFEAFVVGHFRNRVVDILTACKGYMDGVQVGCGVGNKERCCSIEFRNEVAMCIRHLKFGFNKMGATEAEKFTVLDAPTPSSPGSYPIFKAEFPILSASTSTISGGFGLTSSVTD